MQVEECYTQAASDLCTEIHLREVQSILNLDRDRECEEKKHSLM